jgi:hypothetical protein
MTDLIIGIALLLAVSVLLFGVGSCWARGSRRKAEFTIVATILTMILYAVFVWDQPWIAWLLPFSNLIVVSNWFLPLMSFIAGLVWKNVSGHSAKRLLYCAALIGAGGYALIKPVWGTPPQCESRWKNGVCLQTSPKTCSAACAATVLREIGIETTEGEMAELCLTRAGTHWKGLYRGLKLKTADTGWHVEVFEGDVRSLRLLSGPLIVSVGALKDQSVDPIYTQQFGWKPGELHTALLYKFVADDRVKMGDPGIDDGREEWLTEHLEVLYRGHGMRLVRDPGE